MCFLVVGVLLSAGLLAAVSPSASQQVFLLPGWAQSASLLPRRAPAFLLPLGDLRINAADRRWWLVIPDSTAVVVAILLRLI